jgi:hypothetical protein
MHNMANVDVKLREAQLGLNSMRDQEQRTFGDKHFDDYLSAFLNAARTVDYRPRGEFPEIYPTCETAALVREIPWLGYGGQKIKQGFEEVSTRVNKSEDDDPSIVEVTSYNA